MFQTDKGKRKHRKEEYSNWFMTERNIKRVGNINELFP